MHPSIRDRVEDKSKSMANNLHQTKQTHKAYAEARGTPFNIWATKLID